MEQFVICDLDGCIADNPIRAQQYRSGNFNPDTAYCSIPDDVVIQPTLELLNILTSNADIPVVFITCRQERFRELTRDWLMAKLGPYGAAPLLMRPNGDQSGDAQLKPQLLISSGYDYRRAVAALDDQPAVVRAWQALGIPTYMIDNQSVDGATVYVHRHYENLLRDVMTVRPSSEVVEIAVP